jgi:hypothetical protein
MKKATKIGTILGTIAYFGIAPEINLLILLDFWLACHE